jgi:hypothetical protein
MPQISTEDKQAVFSFVQDVKQAREITVALYPSYSPKLVCNGEARKWGAGLAALYPLTQYTYAGLRLDYAGGQFWMPSCTAGLKADVQLFGHTITPFLTGGAIFPLSGAGDRNGQVGAIVGTGITSVIWSSEDKKRFLNFFYAIEKWTIFDGETHHIGAAFTLKF